MMPRTVDAWYEMNQQHLVAALAAVSAVLERHAAQPDEPPAEAVRDDRPYHEDGATWSRPPALVTLCRAFGLSSFERDVLLLAAGPELDAGFASRCAVARGDPRLAYPTFGLALAALPGAHWSALSPAAPLRRWRLVELGPGETITGSPLRIDERVLHYLTGVAYLDERLGCLAQPAAVPPRLAPSQQQVAGRIVECWSRASGGRPALVALCGAGSRGNEAVAAAASAALGLRLYVMPAGDIPAGAAERELLARLWEREMALDRCALLLDGGDGLADDGRTLRHFLDVLQSAVMVSTRERLVTHRRPCLHLDVPRPTALEQRALWQDALGDQAARLNGSLDRVVAQFDLEASTIREASDDALAGDAGNADALAERLWESCRARARARLGELAERIVSRAGWDDLVLPARQQETLRQIAAQVRQRLRVYQEWGFAERNPRGLGISALFAGPSGTGKTLAAEVLAGELRLDLYRIDLSQVVSKYIGETEKNLRRVFDAAEESGAILLFDEADALFGKRSEVRDSHDRYANIEVSYLLQRMEAYRGLAILTTNLKSAIDPAFLRRLRFVVEFPFPDAEQRAEIWRRSFPHQAPTDGLDAGRLAQLNVAGGSIRNIALAAAFLAADAGEPIGMTHVLRAAQTEYVKLEKALTDAEVAGWR